MLVMDGLKQNSFATRIGFKVQRFNCNDQIEKTEELGAECGVLLPDLILISNQEKFLLLSLTLLSVAS